MRRRTLRRPTKNTVDLDRRLPNSQFVIYPDGGHGGVFQCRTWLKIVPPLRLTGGEGVRLTVNTNRLYMFHADGNAIR
jgi:hypothetical protein